MPLFSIRVCICIFVRRKKEEKEEENGEKVNEDRENKDEEKSARKQVRDFLLYLGK